MNPIKIKMNKTIPGSPDGLTTKIYKKGEILEVKRDITEYLADIFIKINAASGYVAEMQPPESGGLDAPETKGKEDIKDEGEDITAEVIAGMKRDELEAMINVSDDLSDINTGDFRLKSDLADEIIKVLEL